jgi:hypothetical protein
VQPDPVPCPDEIGDQRRRWPRPRLGLAAGGDESTEAVPSPGEIGGGGACVAGTGEEGVLGSMGIGRQPYSGGGWGWRAVAVPSASPGEIGSDGARVAGMGRRRRCSGRWGLGGKEATTLRVKMEMRGSGARGSERRGSRSSSVVVRAENNVTSFSRKFILFRSRDFFFDFTKIDSRIQHLHN